MEEEIWTLDYAAEGAGVEELQQAMREFLPTLEKLAKIKQMKVLFIKAGDPFVMRVDITSHGDPFNPPWPPAFGKTQVGEPKVFRVQSNLSIAKR